MITAQEYLNTFVNLESVRHIPSSALKLDRMKEFLKRLGNPQKGLAIIHVAGSKGKGSTCAFIAHILREAGFKVGLYTSPHLWDVRERIRVLDACLNQPAPKGELFSDQISELDFDKTIQDLKSVLETFSDQDSLGKPTYFEILTAAALVYFKRMKCDIVILETGLGGRLDATNAVESLVSVITPISLEHTDILGDTVERIAQEKAHIIKQACRYAVVAPQAREALDVFKKRCDEVKVQSYFVPDENILPKQWDVSLKGEHQYANAAVAKGVVECLIKDGYNIAENNIRDGIKHAFWPGRFEVFDTNPVFVLDGAHNDSSAHSLVKTFKHIFPGKKALFILGFSADKNYEAVCRILREIAQTVILTKSDHPRALDPEKININCLENVGNVFKTQSVKSAILEGFKNIGQDKLIVVAGSLFVVAQARKIITHRM